jgi:hypothetical protein
MLLANRHPLRGINYIRKFLGRDSRKRIFGQSKGELNGAVRQVVSTLRLEVQSRRRWTSAGPKLQIRVLR